MSVYIGKTGDKITDNRGGRGSMAGDSLSFCPALQELYDTKKTIGRSGKDLRGWALSTPNNLVVLRALLMERQPQTSIEVGMANGGSTLTFAASFRDLGRRPDRQHVAIDPFQTTYWDDTGRMALEAAGLADYVDVREDSSCRVLPALAASNWKCDLAYIDGSHLFEDVFIDLYFVFQILNQDGIVLFDDSADPHVKKVIRFVRRNLRDCLAELDLQPYRPAGKSLWHYRVARALGKVQLTGFRKTGPMKREWNAKLVPF